MALWRAWQHCTRLLEPSGRTCYRTCTWLWSTHYPAFGAIARSWLDVTRRGRGLTRDVGECIAGAQARGPILKEEAITQRDVECAGVGVS